MGLNISSGNSEEFKPWVKYNAKAGRWYVKKDEGEVEVDKPTFVADFDNIKTGWFYFAAGVAPSIVYDPDLATPAPKPSENHKRGFELEVFSQNAFGGVVVFSSTSALVGGAINEVFEQYEKERGNHPGQLPVVQCTGVTPETNKHGTNYKPTLSIAKWVDRPDDFGAPAGVQTKSEPVQSAPAQSSASEF